MIELSDLGFSYPGTSQRILENLNLSISQGEVYGLLGPSGSGKSTTQKILMGLLKVQSGTASLFGQPLGQSGRRMYERIGVSFEQPALYLRLTALENLELFAALYEGPCMNPEEALRLVDLHDAATQRVESFSKGMKMRLNLCRAILHDPDVLFLDEPTSGQDPARARLTRELILRLKSEGKTVFLTTHNMSEAAEICDRVGFLSQGHIPVEGTPADLMRKFGTASVKVTSEGVDGISSRTFPLEGLAESAEFKMALTAGILSIHSEEASLDDVFIAATSRLSEFAA